jgi:hypothetical protein
MRRVEFEAADRAWHASRDRYRLSPPEAYVLRSAPIRGLSQAPSRPRRGHAAFGRVWTIWLVHDEDRARGGGAVAARLARPSRRRWAGLAELTAEGRAALEGFVKARIFMEVRSGLPEPHRSALAHP